ncbi:MAG: flagellar operon protein [Anaerocolumna sp.]|jgi:flagellar operon protein|nr:flagellar operon protein [Anaerocolumna sp.]
MNHIQRTNYSSIEQMSGNLINTKKTGMTKSYDNKLSFQEILDAKQSGSTELKFSKHANERLLSRNIDLSEEQLERLTLGTKKAQEKGINESLVMIDDIAFIVNIKNNTVITAVNDGEDKIFTNIDGAVIN